MNKIEIDFEQYNQLVALTLKLKQINQSLEDKLKEAKKREQAFNLFLKGYEFLQKELSRPRYRFV